MSEWRLGYKVAKLEQRVEALESFIRDMIQAPDDGNIKEEKEETSR